MSSAEPGSLTKVEGQQRFSGDGQNLAHLFYLRETDTYNSLRLSQGPLPLVISSVAVESLSTDLDPVNSSYSFKGQLLRR